MIGCRSTADARNQASTNAWMLRRGGGATTIFDAATTPRSARPEAKGAAIAAYGNGRSQPVAKSSATNSFGDRWHGDGSNRADYGRADSSQKTGAVDPQGNASGKVGVRTLCRTSDPQNPAERAEQELPVRRVAVCFRASLACHSASVIDHRPADRLNVERRTAGKLSRNYRTKNRAVSRDCRSLRFGRVGAVRIAHLYCSSAA